MFFNLSLSHPPFFHFIVSFFDSFSFHAFGKAENVLEMFQTTKSSNFIDHNIFSACLQTMHSF